MPINRFIKPIERSTDATRRTVIRSVLLDIPPGHYVTIHNIVRTLVEDYGGDSAQWYYALRCMFVRGKPKDSRLIGLIWRKTKDFHPCIERENNA